MKKYTYKDLAKGRIILLNDDKEKTIKLVSKAFHNDIKPEGVSKYYYKHLSIKDNWYAIDDGYTLPTLLVIPASEVSLEDDNTMKMRKFKHRERGHIYTNIMNENVFTSVNSICEYSLSEALNAIELIEINDEDEFVLPEKYYVHCEDNIDKDEYISIFYKKHKKYLMAEYTYYPSDDTFRAVSNKHNLINYKVFKYKDIKHLLTMDNKKETREIIGYKCPMDLYGGYYKKGDLFERSLSYTGDLYTHSTKKDFDKIFPAEIVETWEPVYKEEKTLPVIGGKHHGKSKCDNKSGYGVIIYGCQDQIVHTYKGIKLIYENLKEAGVLSFEHASGETVTINEVQQIVEYINSKEK